MGFALDWQVNYTLTSDGRDSSRPSRLVQPVRLHRPTLGSLRSAAIRTTTPYNSSERPARPQREPSARLSARCSTFRGTS
jgi:hypothetical protein